MTEDTIAAVATPLGEGGLAMIRLSGSEALAIADRVFAAKNAKLKPSQMASHTLHFGSILRDGRTVDEVMLAVLRGPRTFTREDTIEVTCHGGLLPARLVLETMLESGARLASPGEFTKRAFLNGRLDLAQAEAVMDLIQSRTELALQAAHEQLAGNLSKRINDLREDLLRTLAHLEAHIDFPDEDLAPDTTTELLGRLEQSGKYMEQLLRTAHEGQLLRRGVRAAIIGRPNSGKSSLLNQLLGRPRAIVSPIAGTTRDTVEETANVRGLPVVFIDTAGLREASDAVEAEGIRRSHDALRSAELLLQVIDVADPGEALSSEQIAGTPGQKRIVVLNKADLPHPPQDNTHREAIEVSCLTGAGIEQLKDRIKQCIWSGEVKAEMLQIAINSRHQAALRKAREATLRAEEALRAGLSLELVALDLRIGLEAVGEIVGRTSTEDLLDSIFGQFCIGK